MSTLQLFVDVYRSTQKEGMYVYVQQDATLDVLPEPLQKQFAKREKAMSLELTADKKLARADARKVIAAIQDQGFYLQLPPGPGEHYMQRIPNDKLSGKTQ